MLWPADVTRSEIIGNIVVSGISLPIHHDTEVPAELVIVSRLLPLIL